MSHKRIILLSIAGALALASHAQIKHYGEGVEYSVEVSETGSTGSNSPLWLNANHYGLSSVKSNSGYLRAAIERPIECDSARSWKLGYGADLALPYNFTSKFVVQQLYAEAQFLKFLVGIGSKERPQEFKNDRLSSGGMTFSTNARPVPQVRAELADWWNITGRAHFLSIKGHLAYGMLTDGDWQERFTGGEDTGIRFSKNVLYHSKAGYFKLGDERRFPLTGMFGLQMVAEFGGEVWNLVDRGGSGNENFDSHQVMSHGFRDFFDALIPGGSDVNDGAFANVAGNQLGSWVFSIDWNTPQWGLRAYLDHYFEDHSMMFFQYGWRDNLIGLEARLPRNPIVSTVVFEHLGATDQSGTVYHDATSVLPEQISGKDSYYCHHMYGAYQHWGQVMGNPLIISPIYNANHNIYAYHNRVDAHHIGLSGNPTPEVDWRLLLTHQRSLGSYDRYFEDNRATHLLGEVTYRPHQCAGWNFALGIAGTTGNLIGKSFGMQATVAKRGMLQRRHKK